MSPSIRASEARVLVQRQIDAVNAAKHVLAMATDLTRVSAQERLINEQERLVECYAQWALKERLRAEAAEKRMAEAGR